MHAGPLARRAAFLRVPSIGQAHGFPLTYITNVQKSTFFTTKTESLHQFSKFFQFSLGCPHFLSEKLQKNAY